MRNDATDRVAVSTARSPSRKAVPKQPDRTQKNWQRRMNFLLSDSTAHTVCYLRDRYHCTAVFGAIYLWVFRKLSLSDMHTSVESGAYMHMHPPSLNIQRLTIRDHLWAFMKTSYQLWTGTDIYDLFLTCVTKIFQTCTRRVNMWSLLHIVEPSHLHL